MLKSWITYASLLVTVIILYCACQQKTMEPLNSEEVETNSVEAQTKPYVILISLDGFRWDYVERFAPPNLKRFIENGAQAESLIPSYPTKTFPNHYTLATGMYPDKHGILGNRFYHYEKDAIYSIGDPTTMEDGTFYGGLPIWLAAKQAGMVTASYFFVGSEADIQGMRPTYYYPYNGSVPNEERVAQALRWLQLPEAERPHFMTLYFSDVDNIGHSLGPNNEERLQETIMGIDENLGKLFNGIEQLNLPINIVVVSDHGMKEVHIDQYIPIESVENDDLYQTIDNGALANIHPNDANQTDSVFNYLQQLAGNFNIYKTEDVPCFEYVPQNENWGPIQIIPDSNYYFTSQRNIGIKRMMETEVFGQHGFDPVDEDMHGIFYANGSAIEVGARLPAIKNVHVYPLICRILDIPIPVEIDGEVEKVEGILRD
ncbi:MAG: ectonucleotide pyrophosphatase/phosphodiesterase [Saprospiraceae bacterium]